MTGYRDLLLHLDDVGSNHNRIRVAIDLAARFGAHLTGFHSLRPAPQVRHYLPSELIDRHRKNVDGRAATLRREFEAACLAAGQPCEWLQSELPPIAGMKLAGRVCDLAILEKAVVATDGPADAWYGEPMLPHELGLRMGRPVLVLPTGADIDAANLGQRVLVAWNGSREASRAVHDALPLLAKAAHIQLLCIDADETGGTPGALMVRHLARHGAKVELASQASGEEPVEAILRDSMQRYGMDLLVMGAYGHSRLREMVFGGVTEAILDGLEKPVLFGN
ncbi:universal stress protein [Ferrovibrio sp.]|uniref:universal stress protein n=1 Tax=Ferrovibrio sp. TaxID=1917215 RepID=UPI0035B1BA00